MADGDGSYEDNAPLSRINREVLRSYVGQGKVSPLDSSKGITHTDEYHAEIKGFKRKQRWMLVKGYFTLLVILVMGALIIWQVYLWSTQNLQGQDLIDRARSKTGGINLLETPE